MAPDEGTCVELGMAYAYGKRCYGFKTDTRSVEHDLGLNPMIVGCMKEVFKDYEGEVAARKLEDYISENAL